MNYYIIAGERSGDLHASNLMKEIKMSDKEAKFRFFGGDYMSEVGGDLVMHYKEMSFMGFLEVLMNIDKILNTFSLCRSDILKHRPDALILVDYSGFNMRMAKFIKKRAPQTKIFYYISPKIWAWNQSRALSIKKVIDKMFVILPFEKDFYKKFDYDVEFVGNPTVDEFKQFKPNLDFRQVNGLSEKPIIAVLPGSRREEVEHMLHFMVSILPGFREFQFIVAGVGNLDSRYYEAFRRENIVNILYDQTYDILANSKVAIVTSGTATLETALFEVPQVVCYATSFISYFIAKLLVKVKYISLVNLIAGKKVVTELIQDNFSPPNLMEELKILLNDINRRGEIIHEYKRIKTLLGEESASANAARQMVAFLKK